MKGRHSVDRILFPMMNFKTDAKTVSMHARRVGMITMIALGETIPPYIGIR
ncbi:unnamed protein product [Penicillium camemberti]|uniref:Str. FM013 n=1 Tax=Penicillium camemberti (strain FM 013) TaxID=1429867 RepID=A0A0G4PLM3_PENC3|nr:unnamed protein product [Penicillium camemberti]